MPMQMSLTKKTVGQVGQVGQALSMRVSAVPPSKTEVGQGGTNCFLDEMSHLVPPSKKKVGQK